MWIVDREGDLPEVDCGTYKTFGWLLLVCSFKFRSAFQPRSAILSNCGVLVGHAASY